MTRKTYCGNLLWQSGLTLLAPLNEHERNLFAVKYHLDLPTVEELQMELMRERAAIEEAMALRALPPPEAGRHSAPRRPPKGADDDISSSKPAIVRSFEGWFFGILSPGKRMLNEWQIDILRPQRDILGRHVLEEVIMFLLKDRSTGRHIDRGKEAS